MSNAIEPTQTVEERVAELEKRFAEMRAELIRLAPPKKDWKAACGTLVWDEISESADRLGREYREQQREP